MAPALRSTLLLGWLAVLAALGPPRRAYADPTPAELRVQFFAPSYRWSERNTSIPDYDDYGWRSLYFSPGIGGRYFPNVGAHGALIDLEYRFDSRVDDPWCLFSPDPCPSFDTDFALAHVGYAYRHIRRNLRHPRTYFLAVTPHVSLATGFATNNPAVPGLPELTPVVGGRFGLDIDLHFGRFFFGWSLQYEALHQTRGDVRWSHFFAWNALPIFRFGVDLGKPYAQ